MAPQSRPDRHAGRVRIIGGQWRRRFLEFPSQPGLRPTPDRVRETVFNWLTPFLPGARCLDLFAGSGAFGIEARSRGAGSVTLVEHDPAVLSALYVNIGRLRADGIEVLERNSIDFLEGPAVSFDIVFVDPPYASGLLSTCLERLALRGWVVTGGLVYFETGRSGQTELPRGWQLLRTGTAGQVGYHLAKAMTPEGAS